MNVTAPRAADSSTWVPVVVNVRLASTGNSTRMAGTTLFAGSASVASGSADTVSVIGPIESRRGVRAIDADGRNRYAPTARTTTASETMPTAATSGPRLRARDGSASSSSRPASRSIAVRSIASHAGRAAPAGAAATAGTIVVAASGVGRLGRWDFRPGTASEPIGVSAARPRSRAGADPGCPTAATVSLAAMPAPAAATADPPVPTSPAAAEPAVPAPAVARPAASSTAGRAMAASYSGTVP